MNSTNEKKGRYNFIIIFFLIVVVGLSVRLGVLTIVQGKKHEKEAAGKKYKEVHKTAARGEIRDRNGTVLANSRAIFTIQGLKSEVLEGKEADVNNKLEKLSKIIGEEGVVYEDSFPIEMHYVEYTNGKLKSKKGNTPIQSMIKRIVKNGIIGELIYLKISENSGGEKIEYSFGERTLNALERDYESIPIVFNNENELEFQGKDLKKWLEKNDLPEKITPEEAILQLIENAGAEKVLTRTMSSPIIRKLAYDHLESKGLVEGIKLVDFKYTSDDMYRAKKTSLSNKFKFITSKSSAKDDFKNILVEINGLRELLITLFDEEKAVLEEVEILFEEKEIDFPFKISKDKKGKIVTLAVKNEKDKKKLYDKYNIESNTDSINAVIKILESEKLTKKFITSENVAGYSQEIILKKGVNPEISIKEWEYLPVAEKNNWLQSHKLDKDEKAESAMKKLKERRRLKENISDYEARKILLIIDEFSNLGYEGYYPVNIAYGIRGNTVAKLEENKEILLGIKVTSEPIRNYPMGSTGAHTIGYIGKISQKEEIKKYIKGKGYLTNSLLGKTGIENSFEKYLKGKDGLKKVEVNVKGDQIKEISNVKAKQGKTVYLTIDSDLQKITDETLENVLKQIRRGGTYKGEFGNFSFNKAYPGATSAAAVAIDPQTGKVLALSNYPSFDLNLFSTGISQEDYQSLIPENEEDPLAPRPLYNTSLQTAVQPGSTYKMVTGMAGIEQGISPTKSIYDYGVIELGDTKFGCAIWNSSKGSHGSVNLAGALSVSCNYYFYSVALGRVDKTGEKLAGKADVSSIMKVADEFGLNSKTGIEVPGEYSSGKLTEESKTESTKALLKIELEKVIDDFFIGKKSKKKKEKAIDEIVSWVTYSEPLSKEEVVDRLKKLNIDGEKTRPGDREDLSDMIKYTYLNRANWGEADAMNISIGQGETRYTPLQMANYVATIANGGKKNKVSVVDRVETYEKSKKVFESKQNSKNVNLNNISGIADIAKGMHLATKSGGVSEAFANFPVPAAGKTGTAENLAINPSTGRAYANYSWFVSYAPYIEGKPEESKIAVAVLIFQGGKGGYSAPVGREIMGQYLKLLEERETSKNE